MLLQCIQQRRSKAKVAGHKLTLVLGAVHTCKIEDKVTILAPSIQFLWYTIKVVFIHGLYSQARMCFVLPCLYIFQCPTEVLTNEAFGTSH